MKYIRLFEERMQDFEIMSSLDAQTLMDELKGEIEKDKYDLDYIIDLVTYGHFDVDVIFKDESYGDITFLMLATILNKVDIVRVLLENGANPNIQKHGYTAITWAILYNRLQVIQALLSHPKIDPNIQRWDGITALIIASEYNNIQAVEELLKHPQIDPNLKDIQCYTALTRANRSQVVQAILDHPNTDPNIQNKYGETALIIATAKDNSQAVHSLLNHPKTDITITNKRGETAWDLASYMIRKKFPNLKPEGE